MSSADHLSELESLRSQVADLARELAERDQSMRGQSHHLKETMQDLREQSHLLRTIIEGTAAETGDEFFASLVTHLTSTLHVQYAVIGEVFEGRLKKIRTLAVSAGGTLVDNFEYDLADTPCATALTQTFACFDRDVQATFPQFQRLADLGAESYCGVPLRKKDGAVIGLLVVMDTKPLQHGDYLQSLLGVFAPRVVVEFERRQAGQERAQALADLHNVMETVPDVMFTLDTQGNLVKWNRRLGDVTGYSPEELLNKPALAFVPLEEQTRTAAAIQRAFTEGYAELDGQLLTKDLRPIPYHWTGALLKNAHGEPIGITGVGRDVSEKKQAEEELTQQRRHLVDAQTLAHLGSWEWDIDNGDVRWSDEQFRIFGHEPGAIAVTYDTFLASLHPDDHDSVLAAINDALLGKRVYDVEYRIVRPNGEVRFIHARGDVYRDATGHPLSMAGTVLDITERKRIEDALRASEERWHLAVRGSNDGIWDRNIQTGDIFFSSRWKAMRGFEDHEIKNDVDEWRSRIHPDDLDRVLQSIEAYLAKHAQEFCEEYRVLRKDGSYMWILDRGVALWTDDGTPLRMVGSESDITEHRQALLRLAEQESLLRSILDAEPECVKRVAADGTLLQMNEAGLCFIETDSFEQVAGRSVYDLVAPEFLELYRSMHEAVIRGASQQLEFQIVGLKGTRRWMESHAVPLQNPIDHRVEHLAITRDISERKRVEEALRESEQRFALAVEGSNDILWDARRLSGEPWNAPQTPIWWSPRVRELLGLEESESFETLDHWASRLHPDDKDRVFGQLAAHLEHRVPYDAEYRLRTNRGDYLWIRGRGQASWDEQGEPRRMSGSCQDITDRKRAEEALRKSEERYARATAVGKVGVWELDVVTGTYHGDPNLKALFGYVGDELSTDPYVWLNLVHPEDQSIALDHWQRILNGERDNYNYELRMLKKDGTVIWTDVRGHAVRDREGQVTHLFGATVDISERKQAQDALAQSERQLRTVLDSLPVGVWFTDQSGKPLLANPAAKQIWSNIKQIGLRTPNNPSGWWETIEPANEPHRWALSHALTTGAPSLNETLDLECLDGTKKTIRNSSVQIQDEAGNILGAIVLNEDITTLRQAQEALQLTQFSVDRAVEGFFWITPDARILYVNEAACRMLEYTRDELTAMTLHDIDPNFPPEVWPTHWDELKQKGSMTFESKHWSRTGRVLETEVTVNYLQYEGKEYNCAIIRNIGERKRADAALCASEERYRELYDDTPTMYFTLATDGTVRSVNRFGAEQLGYRVEELIGHSVLVVFHEHDKETVAASLSECLATPETTRHWEFRKVRKDGSIIWVQETARVGQSSTGETVVLVTCEDITERKRAEEALRRSEGRFRTMFTQAPIGMALIDSVTGQIHEFNSKNAQIAGRTTEEMRSLDWMSITHPDDVQADLDNMARLNAGEIAGFQMEKRYVRPDGTVAWINLTVAPIQAEERAGLRHLAMSEDITERKRAEEALRTSEERFRRLVEAAPLGVTLLDGYKRFIKVNHAFCDLVGYREEEILGQTYARFTHPNDLLSNQRLAEEVNRGERSGYRLERRYVRKDGRTIWVMVNATSLALPGSTEHHVVAIIEDITERKRTEEALRTSEERYRSLVDNAPIGIFVNKAGQFVYANREMQRILNATCAEQLLGTPVLDRIAPEFHQVVKDRIHALMDNRQSVPSLDEQYVRLDGSRVDVAVTAIPTSFDGTPVMQVLVLDIAERKHMEEVLCQRERDLRAAIEERERISQDLHDGILQSLFAIGLSLEATKLMMSSRTRKMSGPPLDQAIDQLNRVMHEIRNFIAGLGSDLLHGEDLPMALQHMVTALTQNQLVRVRLAVEDRAAQAVSVEQSLHLLLVIQEAVSNCIRHGCAKEARVSLKMLKQGVRLSIRDNGRGFNPEAARGTGHGLVNMAARARKIGGRFTVMSKVNEGTRIVLDLPKEASDVLR